MALKTFILDGEVYVARNLTEALENYTRLNGHHPRIIEEGK